MEGGKNMDDKQIVDLYWKRSESAIDETASKYGSYCHHIALNILHNEEYSKECVNDTYLRAWNSMPPNRPNLLSSFLGKITRNLAFDKYKKNLAKKRGSGQIDLVLSELENCVPSVETIDKAIDEYILSETINRFLSSMPIESRKVFMRRYWYVSSIKEISDEYDMSISKVKMILFRSRNELKLFLEREGIAL